MPEVAPDTAPPPGRWLLRPAGVLTQLGCAFALLLGTIAFVLVQQNKMGGAPIVIAWAAAALVGIVLGGLMGRGGMVSVIGSALIDLAFGIGLLVLDWDTLRALLRLLPETDVAMLADVLVGVAVGMIAIAVMCLASIPQARRYNRALREAEDVAEKSGMWMPSSNAAIQVQINTLPPHLMQTQAAYAPPIQHQQPLYGAPPTSPAEQFRGGSLASASNAHMPAAPAEPPRRSSQLPLPPPPETGDGYSPPRLPPPPVGPPSQQFGTEHARTGDRPYLPTSASTAPGWAPAPARTYTTQMLIRPPAVEKRSRRRAYLALAGFAIGVGAGVGVLVSSLQKTKREQLAIKLDPTSTGSAAKPVPVAPIDAGIVIASADAAVTEVAPAVPVRQFLAGQRELLGAGDLKNLALTYASNAFAIGMDAEDIAEGRDAIEAQLRAELADSPAGGWTVASRFLTVGSEKNHAWTAEEIELTGANVAARRIAITQLCAYTNGAWQVVAAHWARPVADATAERLAVLGRLPITREIPNRADDAALGTAVAASFASRAAFSQARSERDDGFNFGSGPGERVIGGAKIKTMFGRLRSELRQTGGARVVAASAWDPSQAKAPWIGFAALNATYTAKSRAATDVTQTFRVLAIMLREGDAWKIVQTQFSNAGPISE